MDCKALVELVTEYLERTLTEPEQARFEAHLGTCSGCQNYLKQMEQTIRTLGKLTEETLPPQSKDELLQIFKNWKDR
ncbi:MAG: anti-sigma factor [Anaerolineales bacterium]|nr:anti-sigma factor [Anaerolineales bacterium]